MKKQKKKSKSITKSKTILAQTRTASRKRKRAAKTTNAPRSFPKVTRALSKMRAGASLRKASRESGVAARTVLKRATSALRKNKSGRYIATSDRLIRVLMIPTPQGPLEINVRGLRPASLLGRYWIAVDRYYETGDTSVKKFEDQSITAVDGTKYPLLTDLDVLNRLGYAGVFSFESLYARSV
jgi:hypothetical protein